MRYTIFILFYDLNLKKYFLSIFYLLFLKYLLFIFFKLLHESKASVVAKSFSRGIPCVIPLNLKEK